MKKILAASLIFVSSMASAAYYSGNDLYNKLNSKDTADRIMALGYIAGVHDVIEGTAVCTPQGVTLGQLGDIVLRKLLAVPEQRHHAADMIVFVALSESFPCKAKKKT